MAARKHSFQPEMLVRHRIRSEIAQLRPSNSTAEIQSNITRLISRHEQVKTAYHQLKSQITAGLLEAEEVFASLAIPLMKLVGLKTLEMAEEGRFTSIVFDTEYSYGSKRRNGSFLESQGDSFANRATMAGKELLGKQQLQFKQLVRLLRQTENGVNSSQNVMFQTLDDQHVDLHNSFQKAIYFLSACHIQNQDTFSITIKLLQALFRNVSSVLSSVEEAVENLIQELAEQMCNPMVQYMKGVKDEMTNGMCVHLLAMVEEMERMIIDGRIELEEARKKVRVAEKEKVEAFCQLKETEERARRMEDKLRFLSEAGNGHVEPSFLNGEDQATDEKLLWELLKKKRKYQAQDSPMGPKMLLYWGTNSDEQKSKRAKPSIARNPVAMSFMRGRSPQSPCVNGRIPLGSSPSVAIQTVVSRKRIIT